MITLTKICQSQEIPMHALYTGWNSLGSISYVTIIEETRVNRWMRGREFLLVSTLTLLKISDLDHFVQMLCDNRCCALAVKITEGHPIPNALVESGARHHLPLFALDPNASYADVMGPINELLVKDEQKTFFDALTAKHLLDTPDPKLEMLELDGVKDLRAERLAVMECNVTIAPDKMIPEANGLWPLLDDTASLLSDTLERLKNGNVIDAYVLLRDALDLRTLVFFNKEQGSGAFYSSLREGLGSSSPLYIGISTPCRCDEGSEAARQARFALSASGLASGQDGTLLEFADVEFFSLVESLARDVHASPLFENCESLRDYPTLLNTLTVYFRHNEQIKATSEALFIHANTLRYRLDQIKRITGLDWSKSPDKIKLFLGVVHLRQREWEKSRE